MGLYDQQFSALLYDKGGAFYNVKHPDFGALGDGSTDDRAAILSAVSAVETAGGGTIVFPPGTYSVDRTNGNIELPSNVTILLINATIQHSAVGQADTVGAPDNGLFYTKRTTTTGSTTAASNVVSVADATDFDVGDLVGVLGLDGGDAGQATTINDAGGINDTDTSFTIASGDGWGSGTHALLIESEVIRATISGTTVTVVERGAYGTSAASHADTTAVQAVLMVVARVQAVSGTDITLEDPSADDHDATLTLTSVPVWVGSQNVAIMGTGTLDGRQDRAGADVGSNPNGIRPFLCSGFKVGEGIIVKGFDSAGLLLDCCWDFDVGGQYHLNGRPADTLGYNALIFRQCANGIFRPGRLTDSTWGMSIDDRTTNTVGGHPFEGPPIAIRSVLPNIHGVLYGATIVGGDRCDISAGYIEASTQAIQISSSSQWPGTTPKATKHTIRTGAIDATGGTAIQLSGDAEESFISTGEIIGGSVSLAGTSNSAEWQEGGRRRTWGRVDIDDTAASTTGTGFEVVKSVTVPGGLIARAGEAVRIKAWGDFAANTNSKQTQLRIGGTNLVTGPGSTHNNIGWYMEATIQLVSSSGTQKAWGTALVDNWSNGPQLDVSAPTVDFTADWTIDVRLSGGAASDVTVDRVEVEPVL